jgi:ribonucleoside-triphosphate reductase
MSKKSRKNHENNEIYIHDLDSFSSGMHNCLSIPFDDLLANGFKTKQTDVRPAGSVNTAMQLVAVIMQLQSLQQFGGVAATHLDWTMVPYVRKSFWKHYCNGMRYIAGEESTGALQSEIINTSINDDKYTAIPEVHTYAVHMTKKEIYQAVEGLYHNLNTLQSRSGNQLPFSSINYGTCTLPEGRMIIKALLDVSIEGLGTNGRTSIFPCGIFQYMKGVNDKPGTPNYDMYQLALRSTAQRLYPNYANCDWTAQNNWCEKDRKDKQQYIDALNDTDKNNLIEKLEKYPELCDMLGIDITNE